MYSYKACDSTEFQAAWVVEQLCIFQNTMSKIFVEELNGLISLIEHEIGQEKEYELPRILVLSRESACTCQSDGGCAIDKY